MFKLTSEKDYIIVMKFGGSCLQDAESFGKTVEIIKSYKNKSGSPLIIVSSAIKGTTDKLINFYKKSCEEAPECDFIIESIYNIHKKIIDEIIDGNKPEYIDTLNFLDENLQDLGQLGNLEHPAKVGVQVGQLHSAAQLGHLLVDSDQKAQNG